MLSNFVYQIETNKLDTSDYCIGDIVVLEEEYIEKINSLNMYKNNVYYRYNKTPIKTGFRLITIKTILSNRINEIKDLNIRAFVSKFILMINDYVNLDDDIVGISISIYALFKILYKILEKIIKNTKILDILFIILLIEIYGINCTILRILLIIIYYDKSLDKLSTLTIIIIVLMLYNPYYVVSSGFILSFGLRIALLFKHNISIRTLLLLFQSVLYGNISLIKLLFYKYYVLLYLILYLTIFVALIFNNELINDLYNVAKFIESFDIFYIKGQVNIILVFITIVIIKEFKINNYYVVNLLLILCITSNISNIYGSVSFIDVGQGDAILIKSPFNQENILIDTGSEYNYYKLKKYLDSKGIYQIDYLIITHFDSDHSGNIKSLINDYNVINIVYEHKDICTDYFLFKSLNHEVWKNKNDNSLVYSLNFNNLNYIFTGDISIEVENYLIDNNPNLSADILKLSHHGSQSGNSKRFLYYLKPTIAIASTSGMYHHPSEVVIENCNDMHIKTFITNQDKDIEVIMTKLLSFIYTKNGEFVIIK